VILVFGVVALATLPPRIHCTQCKHFAAVLKDAQDLRERLTTFASHRDMIRRSVIDEAGWKTLRGRGRRASIVRSVVSRMEAAWAPSVPVGGHALPLRLGDLVYLSMGVQCWLDHLRRQPGRGQTHAAIAGLSEFYSHCQRALGATKKRWPTLRSSAMTRIVAALLRIPPRTVHRRMQEPLTR
jgi:hypothetical protein